MSTEAIEKLTIQVRRIADMLERAFPPSAELTPAEQEELAKLDAEAESYANNYAREEMLAVVEMIEGSGRKVPDAAYKRLNIEPPARKLPTAPSAEVLEAAQPGAEERPPAEPERPAEPPNPNTSRPI